jgi:hypothetical protein
MKRTIITLALFAVLVLPASALAQSASEGYGQDPGTRVAGTANNTGVLPFTGLELGGLIIVGMALIGVGLALHATRRRNEEQV